MNLGGEDFDARQISAFVLQKLKRDAEAHRGETVTDVVMSVPALLSEPGRQATREAAQPAGLNVLRLVDAPSAAAPAYGLEHAALMPAE
ncbi:hypothetical protein A6A07_16610 [Streptomyces sp. CB03911]|nr:hypothetical protein A6A07_16610 [Streptomyces sp. CB03911]